MTVPQAMRLTALRRNGEFDGLADLLDEDGVVDLGNAPEAVRVVQVTRGEIIQPLTLPPDVVAEEKFIGTSGGMTTVTARWRASVTLSVAALA